MLTFACYSDAGSPLFVPEYFLYLHKGFGGTVVESANAGGGKDIDSTPGSGKIRKEMATCFSISLKQVHRMEGATFLRSIQGYRESDHDDHVCT